MTLFKKLFEPGKIGSMELKNRIVMAPMITFLADDQGCPTEAQIDYYVERAKGGVGLIICASARPVKSAWMKNNLAVWDDKFIPGLRKLASAIKGNAAKAALQLCHTGIFLSEMRWRVPVPEEVDVLGPSSIPYVKNGFIPREATQEDIRQIAAFFAQGVRRAKEAGFDAVEFHGAHGYLISAFLSPFSNKRTDDYGGSPENRARLACDILEASRKEAGPDFPLIFRMTACDYLNGGITLDESLKQAPLFVEAGASALHVSASAHESTHWQFLPYLFPDGAITHLAEAIKKVVKVPIITVGKLGTPSVAEQVLEQGKADFIALGRPLLADPAWPNKVRKGELEEITACIWCNLGCAGRDRKKFRTVSCTVNPMVAREREFVLKPAKKRKNVMVVGGGLAGMEAAKTLALRGHRVALYEQSDRLGGQWNIACLQEGKEIFASLTEKMIKDVGKAGVEVILGKRVERAFIEQAEADAVIIATGAVPAAPKVTTEDGGTNVVQAVDIIQGRASAGGRVVVIGARYLGIEIALFLAKRGRKVSLVDQFEIGNNVERNHYLALREKLLESGISLFPNAPLFRIRPNGVYLSPKQELLFLSADTIVLAAGSKPENSLFNQLRFIVPQIYAIGDCVEPRNAFFAIREGAELGRYI